MTVRPRRAIAMRRCHECNYPLGNRDRFCPRCGAKQPREQANPDIIALMGKDPLTAHFARTASTHG